MTVTLHLGVIDLPYVDPQDTPRRLPRARKGKQRPRGKTASGGSGSQTTTGFVAEVLEKKYHVIETYYDLHELEIADSLAESVAGALENLVMGGPPIDPTAEAASGIEKGFKTYLESGEIEGTATPGVPTRAALHGVSHRFKGKNSGVRRPSFIDTGLYESSFKAWTETR